MRWRQAAGRCGASAVTGQPQAGRRAACPPARHHVGSWCIPPRRASSTGGSDHAISGSARQRQYKERQSASTGAPRRQRDKTRESSIPAPASARPRVAKSPIPGRLSRLAHAGMRESSSPRRYGLVRRRQRHQRGASAAAFGGNVSIISPSDSVRGCDIPRRRARDRHILPRRGAVETANLPAQFSMIPVSGGESR